MSFEISSAPDYTSFITLNAMQLILVGVQVVIALFSGYWAVRYKWSLDQFAFVNQTRFSLSHSGAIKACERIYAFLTEGEKQLIMLRASSNPSPYFLRARRYINKAELRILNSRLYLPLALIDRLLQCIKEQRLAVVYGEEGF